MKIPEALVWGMPPEGISGLYIYCDQTQRDAVSKFFAEKFNNEWDAAVKATVTDDEEIECPATVHAKDFGIYVFLDPLCISYDDEQSCDHTKGDIALDNTLKALEKEFPDISYEGYVAYHWSDASSGEVEQYAIKSSNLEEAKETFNFVADRLTFFDAEDLETDDEDELKEILTFLYAYKDSIDFDEAAEGILDYADEQDDDMRESLEETIEKLKEE